MIIPGSCAVCFVPGSGGLLRSWFHFLHLTDKGMEWGLGNSCWGVWGGGGGRERRNKLLFQKAWGTEGQTATALPENPVLYSAILYMFFLLGMQGYGWRDMWCLVFGLHEHLFLFCEFFSISCRCVYCALKSNFPLHDFQPLEDF